MNIPDQEATRYHPQDKKAWCCVIGCDQPATKCIWTPPFSIDDYTHSCDEHIEDLKVTEKDVVDDL